MVPYNNYINILTLCHLGFAFSFTSHPVIHLRTKTSPTAAGKKLSTHPSALNIIISTKAAWLWQIALKLSLLWEYPLWHWSVFFVNTLMSKSSWDLCVTTAPNYHHQSARVFTQAGHLLQFSEEASLRSKETRQNENRDDFCCPLLRISDVICSDGCVRVVCWTTKGQIMNNLDQQKCLEGPRGSF